MAVRNCAIVSPFAFAASAPRMIGLKQTIGIAALAAWIASRSPERAGLNSPEVPQTRKDYDHAYQARSQHIADIVAGHACASLYSGFFNSSLGVVFGHGRSSPLLTNGFANDEFHKFTSPAKTASPPLAQEPPS
jgi:hypothetical protein